MPFFELNDVFGYQDANDIKKLWADTSEPDPATIESGEIWLDTSSAPYKLKRYNGTAWDIIAGGISIDSTGNVGIGTTTPTVPLEIETTGTIAKIYLNRTDGATGQFTAADSNVQIGSASNHGLRLVTNGSVKATVTEDGNVGIGTTGPETQLHVANTGSAASVKVERTDPGIKTWIKSTGTAGMVGTETSHDFYLLTGNGPKMVIDTSGNVGIGTITPSELLELNTTGADAKMLLDRTDGATGLLKAAQLNINVGSVSNHPLRLVTNGSVKATVTEDGKIGIGTTSPDRNVKLETTGANAEIVAQRTDGASVILSGGNNEVYVGSTSNHELRLLTNGNVKVTIDTSGNTGIGTTTPAAKLDVNGDINCTDLAVTNGGKDLLSFDPTDSVLISKGLFKSELYNETIAVNDVLVTNIKGKSTGLLMIQMYPEERGAIASIATDTYLDVSLLPGCFNAGTFSTVKDTSGRVNIYFENAVINIQNKKPFAVTLRVGCFCCRMGS
jgi:hypothetical protein